MKKKKLDKQVKHVHQNKYGNKPVNKYTRKEVITEDKITLQGNKKHHTRHNEYVCYNCGTILDRDENAVQNLLDLIN